MIRHVWLALIVCAMTALVFLIFSGWRQGGEALLQLHMMC